VNSRNQHRIEDRKECCARRSPRSRWSAPQAVAQTAGSGFAAPGGYGVKIYRVDRRSTLRPGLLPTFDQNQQPLVNLNEMNIGLMVQGPLLRPDEAAVLCPVHPAAPGGHSNGHRARRQQVNGGTALRERAAGSGPLHRQQAPAGTRSRLLAIRDTKDGYELSPTSSVTRGPWVAGSPTSRRDGKKTRLYDSIGAAIQMCGMSAQGSSAAPSASNYVVSCSIVVLSDGHDEGSAVSRESSTAASPTWKIPNPRLLRSLFEGRQPVLQESGGSLEELLRQVLPVGEAFDRMQRVVEEVAEHPAERLRRDLPLLSAGRRRAALLQAGHRVPRRQRKYTYDDGRFEALEPPRLRRSANSWRGCRRQCPRCPTAIPISPLRPPRP